ncbi:hypothetical protein E1293_25995 [Actinomadura darangshiensis]|uniref:Uncharacterized protein n=1 Tax=Actinomadura darangshiensis TaxID=705336 RepID=A0A4R5AZP8_9ACTN|nr:hypothetical protein [Actinomadura darangshiensis]TDD77650.1 hypothetical protein E1293_25995 [Actinomadura darangshiensis]
MGHPPSPVKASPRVMNPLWIISLFLGLTEVTIGVVTTQATGWIQALLAVFAVLFPSGVAGVFFRILWKKPWVLYAPGDYEDEGIFKDLQQHGHEYAATVSTATDRSLENLEAAMRSAFEKVVDPALVVAAASGTGVSSAEDPGDAGRSVVDEAVKMAREHFQQRVIEVDLSEIDAGLARFPLIFPVTDSTTVGDLLDNVYFAIAASVRVHSYNKSWVLEDAGTGRTHTEIGTAWARRELNEQHDWRPLSKAGIEPGSRLRAKLLRPADR